MMKRAQTRIKEKNSSALAKAMKIASLDALLFDAVYDAALFDRKIIITDFIHPTGMLPFPDGRKCVTDLVVREISGKYVQVLREDIVDLVTTYPKLIQVLIWLPVSWYWRFDIESKCKLHELMQNLDFVLINDLSLNKYEPAKVKQLEEIAGQILILFKTAGVIPYDDMEDEYERERFI